VRYLLLTLLMLHAVAFAVPSVPIDNILLVPSGAFENSTLDKTKSSAVAYRYNQDETMVLYKNSSMTWEDWCKVIFKNFEYKDELIDYYKGLPIEMLTRPEARAIAQSWQPTENIDD